MKRALWSELERMSIPERAAYVRGRAAAALFPGAPAGSYVNEDGWLICDDEAWTPREWASRLLKEGLGTGKGRGRPRRYDDDRHRQAREHKRQLKDEAS